MNNIRQLRKAQGMTQAELARRLETSVATISRLESADIRLSADWLTRIAEALGARMGELIEERGRPALAALGHIRADGWAVPGALPDSAGLLGDVPLADPVQVLIGADQGGFKAGEVLIADRLPSFQIPQLYNRPCLAGLEDGRARLARLVPMPESDAPYLLVPLGDGEAFQATALSWAARPVLAVRAL
ncbi:helix-turn-helix domain-containing protein [Tepidicaulis sp.]|uniref:helix-turn-helix domain-containing protein n=1 Tax=Tepidicaulis sp. TaxID=1920809 RepID=UPI003B597865